MTGGIYMIRHDSTSRCYVGQSINVFRRRRRHMVELRKGTHRSPYFQNTFNKYGENGFSFHILEIISDPFNKEMMTKAEQRWIDKLKPCFNVAPAAGSNLGIKLPKGRISPWKGKKPTEESRRLMSIAKLGKPSAFKGRTLSEEAKEKIRLSHLGKPSPRKGKPGKSHSLETRMKMSSSQKGKHSVKRKPWSLEAKLKHSETIRNVWAFRRQAEMSA